MKHHSGYVNIIGHPNVGKSTLLNKLFGDKISIITHKPQTTRHRILAIHNEEDYQIIFSDSPGVIEDPSYKMHESMNRFALSGFKDADVLLFMSSVDDEYHGDEKIISELKKLKEPKILVLNKMDISDQKSIEKLIKWWSVLVDFDEIFVISALENFGVAGLLKTIKSFIKEGPAYYPKDQISDKPERFFVSEIIREKILSLYKQEIPYSCEVIVERFKEKEDLLSIESTIFVARNTQKSIVIGKGGTAIKRLGIDARKDIEHFFNKKVFLELHVKVRENWRDNDKMLKNFGYQQ